MYDIIIVGAGPAGLTAALYALRARKKVLIIEAKAYGGQIINAHRIENYPGIKEISGYEFATTLYNQVKDLGAIIKYETVLRVDETKKVITNKDTYEAKSVIIATGAESRKLNIDNESKFLGKGVSYCATCDGAFFKGEDVAIVGGGNTALEDALYLANIVNHVYVIHRRNTFKADAKVVEEVKKKENIEIIYNATISSLNGDDSLESIDILENEDKKNIKVKALFIAVGQEPKNEIFANVASLNKGGFIVAHNDVYTDIPGIYVAGDAREKTLRQLTTAVSDGSLSATIAIKELNK